MRSWVEYIRNQGDDELLWNTGFHYGDWLALDADEGSYIGATPKDLIATAFYANSTNILAKTARILDIEDDADFYKSLHNQIVKKFEETFLESDGTLCTNTQTAHVITLMFDLVTNILYRERIIRSLVHLIEENNYRLTTGFVGTPYLCHVLTDNGYHDVACKLLYQTEYPSWLYSISQGATTIWEHWDGINLMEGFGVLI